MTSQNRPSLPSYLSLSREQPRQVVSLPPAASLSHSFLLITSIFFFFLFSWSSSTTTLQAEEAPSADLGNSNNSAPWTQQRDLNTFNQLLERSPFSLPTAEESSPLSDRYNITGHITINGEDQIFVFDKNDQTRQIVTKIPNAQGLSLVDMVPDDQPGKIKASIKLGEETGVISSDDSGSSSSEEGEDSSYSGMPSQLRGSPYSPYSPINKSYPLPGYSARGAYPGGAGFSPYGHPYTGPYGRSTSPYGRTASPYSRNPTMPNSTGMRQPYRGVYPSPLQRGTPNSNSRGGISHFPTIQRSTIPRPLSSGSSPNGIRPISEAR